MLLGVAGLLAEKVFALTGLKRRGERERDIYSATGANKQKEKLKIKVRQEQVVSKMTDKLVAHNSLNSRCWQSVCERCTRQPAIGDD